MSALDDDALAALGHLDYIEFGRELTRQGRPASVLCEEAGLLFHASPSPFPVVFNGVWRLDPRVPGADVITRADSFFGAIDRGYSIAVRDDVAEDADLVVAAPRPRASPRSCIRRRWCAAADSMTGRCRHGSTGLRSRRGRDTGRHQPGVRRRGPGRHRAPALTAGQPYGESIRG